MTLLIGQQDPTLPWRVDFPHCSLPLRAFLFLVIETPSGVRKNSLLLLVLFLLIFRNTFKMSRKLKTIIPKGLLANLVLTKAYWDISLPQVYPPQWPLQPLKERILLRYQYQVLKSPLLPPLELDCLHPSLSHGGSTLENVLGIFGKVVPNKWMSHLFFREI